MLKRLYFIGFSAYIIMLFLSLLFFKERTIFLDMAFNLFYIINKGGFAIQIFRFGDILTQLPPFFAAKAGLPLDTILQLYSAGFVVFYFITYFICGSLLKRYDFALVILLLNVLFAADTFYWMLSQLPQAIAMLIVVFALASTKSFQSAKLLSWVLIILTLITIVFFHPLILFVISFSLLFFVLGNHTVMDKKLSWSIAIIYAAGMLLKFFFFKTPYEAHSLSGLKNFFTLFPDYFTMYSNRRFLASCLTKYYWLPVFFTLITAYYFKIRAWRKLGLFLISFVGYLMLVNISYPTTITPAFYIENLYLPLAVFIAFPLVFDLLPVLPQKNIAVMILSIIIVSSGLRFYYLHPIYSARLDYERKLLDQYGDQKVIVNATKTDTDVLLMTWGTPYELLLLSESERHKPASIVVDENPDLRIWAGSQTKTLVVNYNLVPYNKLNTKYFAIVDTNTIYTIIKTRRITN